MIYTPALNCVPSSLVMSKFIDEDDSSHSLLQIAVHHNRSIIQLLVGAEWGAAERDDNFIQNLECFHFETPGGKRTSSIRLTRHRVDATKEMDYVALSYTWNPSQYENGKRSNYLVQRRSPPFEDQRRYKPSRVRLVVFERIKKYMEHQKVNLLWIDQHSLPQPTCEEDNCTREPCIQKRKGIQSMDRVYSLSNFPVALLGRPIQPARELFLLHAILKGSLILEDLGHPLRLLQVPNRREDVFGALRLAYEITSDLWWQRAWTFQENYKTERKMCLVISHHKDLEQEKRDYGSFGQIPGELCVKSRYFSIYVTKLCLAIEQTGKALKGDLEMTKYIKATAGYYALLQEMSGIALPHVLKNVEKRSLSKIWDRLDIIANCLEFSVRMAAPKKPQNEARYSMSISMLAMCLLNGQILDNKEHDRALAEDLTVSQFLEDYSLDNFYPTNATAYLARNKGCRLVDTELTEEWHPGYWTSLATWRDCFYWQFQQQLTLRGNDKQFPEPQGSSKANQIMQLATASFSSPPDPIYTITSCTRLCGSSRPDYFHRAAFAFHGRGNKLCN